MSSLICFPNKVAKPASGVCAEFAFAGNAWRPAEDGAAGEGIDLVGASCSSDPGNEAVGECGKRLSDSLWASEDLSSRSKTRRDVPASRGSPEWAGAVDSQRAISLDASECLTEMRSLSLVRSTALEDLTSIGDRGLWASQGEEIISEITKDEVTADAALKSCSDFESRNISPETQQPPSAQNLSYCLSDSCLEDPHGAHSSRNFSKKDRLLPKMTSGTETENSSSDSSEHRASNSKPDSSDDLDIRSKVAQTTGIAELQKTPPQSPAARKSLVPVAVFKGLFAVMFTS